MGFPSSGFSVCQAKGCFLLLILSKLMQCCCRCLWRFVSLKLDGRLVCRCWWHSANSHRQALGDDEAYYWASELICSSATDASCSSRAIPNPFKHESTNNRLHMSNHKRVVFMLYAVAVKGGLQKGTYRLSFLDAILFPRVRPYRTL